MNRKRKWIVVVLGLLFCLVFVFFLWRSLNPEQAEQRKSLANLEDRVEYLRQIFLQRRNATFRLALIYSHESKVALEDLAFPAPEFLKDIPFVLEIQAKEVPKATKRIIHLFDAPLMNPQPENSAAKGLSKEEKILLQREAELQKAILLAEQLTVLDCLVKEYGLQEVGLGELALEDLPEYQAKINQAKGENWLQSKELGQMPSQKFQKALVDLGPAGWLLMLGKLKTVRPLCAPRPLPGEPSQELDLGAFVQRILAHPGACHVLLLLGTYDLSESIKQAAPACEYIRVATSSYKKFTWSSAN